MKAKLRKERRARLEKEANKLQASMPFHIQRAMELAREKGASALFTVLPLERHGFCFKAKRDWRDLVRMRYRLPIRDLPSRCACGKVYSLDHSQICHLGGFVHMRHDEENRLFAVLAKEAFHDVEIEPPLTKLSGEIFDHKTANMTDEARSDTRVRNFWGNKANAFFDFRVFYPFANSYVESKITSLYTEFEKTKEREYKQRIREVEDGSFTPMIMSSTGGMGPQMTAALKHLAAKLAEKK